MAYYKIAEPTYRRTNDGHIDGKYGLKSNNSTQVDDEKKVNSDNCHREKTNGL